MVCHLLPFAKVGQYITHPFFFFCVCVCVCSQGWLLGHRGVPYPCYLCILYYPPFLCVCVCVCVCAVKGGCWVTEG